MQIEGTTALVTGAASGLGAATAAALAARGATVVGLDLASQIEKVDAAGGGHPDGVTLVAADVTSADDVAAALAAIDGPPLRIVVNCAGIAPARRVLSSKGVHELDLFRRTIEVNLIGTFNVLRLAAEAMAATEPATTEVGGPERGVIINTASVAAFDGQIGQPAYAASKGAVAAMTLPIARELARSLIRVVTIAPGIFETPMMAGLPQDAQESLGRQVPHPSRLGKPAEYASLVAHIVENAMLNGETIRLDGAIRMGPK